MAARIETRRLVDWFNVKFFDEVTNWLITEKVYKRFAPPGGAPDMDVVRVARANIRHHMRYIGYLTNARNWLAGDRLTYADFAAAAHISCADYLGDAPWDEDEAAKHWYQRIKSRPAFRPLLSYRAPGLTPGPLLCGTGFLSVAERRPKAQAPLSQAALRPRLTTIGWSEASSPQYGTIV